MLAAGHQLLASARNPAQLADLSAKYGDQVRIFGLNVTDPRAANNAGYGDIGFIEETSLDDIRAQIETNLFGVINVTKAAIPIIRE